MEVEGGGDDKEKKPRRSRLGIGKFIKRFSKQDVKVCSFLRSCPSGENEWGSLQTSVVLAGCHVEIVRYNAFSRAIRLTS